MRSQVHTDAAGNESSDARTPRGLAAAALRGGGIPRLTDLDAERRVVRVKDGEAVIAASHGDTDERVLGDGLRGAAAARDSSALTAPERGRHPVGSSPCRGCARECTTPPGL